MLFQSSLAVKHPNEQELDQNWRYKTHIRIALVYKLLVGLVGYHLRSHHKSDVVKYVLK